MTTPKSTHTRITRLSGLFRLASLLSLTFCVLAALTLLVTTLLDLNHYAPYFFGGALLFACAAAVAFHFFRFFSRLRAGHRFDPVTVAHLHNAGRWWLAFAAYYLALTLFGRYALHMTQLQLPLSPFLPALTVLLAAWLFREAQFLQQDHELTV